MANSASRSRVKYGSYWREKWFSHNSAMVHCPCGAIEAIIALDEFRDSLVGKIVCQSWQCARLCAPFPTQPHPSSNTASNTSMCRDHGVNLKTPRVFRTAQTIEASTRMLWLVIVAAPRQMRRRLS